ncbi:MAG: hypothetical protein MJZ17_11615 [Bacteroidales bacterium]|nr:hypothetical protein [Bacteroidales bacterium]
MNRYLYLSVAVLALAVCGCNRSAEVEDDTPDAPVENPMVVSNEKVNMPSAILGTVGGALESPLKERFTNLSSAISEVSRVVIVPWDSFLQNSEIIQDALKRRSIIVVTYPDDNALNGWLVEKGLTSILSEAGDSHLITAFGSHCGRFDLADPAKSDPEASGTIAAYLNGFVSWVNASDSIASVPHILEIGDEMADIAKTFDHMRYDKTYQMSISEELGHVALSSPDVVKASSQAMLHLEYYPLYSFEDQASNGDYYLFTAKFTVENKPMYKGVWKNKHGGVRTHLCAYILDYIDLKFELVGTEDTPLFDLGPNPETTPLAVTHEEGMSWNIGGSITGGVSATGPELSGTINGGASFSNSNSITYPDLVVNNNSSGGVVNIRYYVADEMAGYMQGTHMIEPKAEVCKSNAVVQASWVWRVSETKDNSTKAFKLKISPKVAYYGMRFYSTAIGDGAFTYVDNAITGDDVVIDVHAPNRVPTGIWKLKNSDESGVYVSDIKVWKASEYGTGAAPVLTVDESIDSGDTYSAILPTGDYRAELSAGKSSSAMTRRTCKKFTIARGDVHTSNSGFDFE